MRSRERVCEQDLVTYPGFSEVNVCVAQRKPQLASVAVGAVQTRNDVISPAVSD